MAKTYTSTKTYTRILFLQIQIMNILRSTTQISDDSLNRLLEAVEKKWIKNIDVYALNVNNLCQAKLSMDIDWDEYNRQIAIGKLTVSVDKRWKDDLLPQTDSAIWAFNEYIKHYGLRTEWRLSYTDHVWKNPTLLAEARKFVGTSPGNPVKWSGNTLEEYLRNKDFPDFGIGLTFVE